MSTRTIVAIGGLPGSAIGTQVESYLLSLCKTDRPRVCFVPTASGDSRELESSVALRFATLACDFNVVHLFERTISDLSNHLRQQHLVLVGGGNTANLLAIWSAHHMDTALSQAWENGVVLAGWGAGAMCWFQSGITGSFGPDLQPFEGGLGLLDGSFCPHYEERNRKRKFQEFVKTQQLAAGLAAEEGVLLRFTGRELAEVVTLLEGRTAYRVAHEGSRTTSKKLATRLLSPDAAKPSAQPASKSSERSRPTVAYTDGACSGNPGPGGWAWAVAGNGFASGAESHTTNQRMEVTAAYQAVLAHDGPLQVVSDSTYVVNCFKQRWWEGWLKRGWINSQRRPVANRDLWEPFIELVRKRGNVGFTWVKGHSSDQMNRFVDQLAVEASQSQQGRSGQCPDDLRQT